MESTNEWKQIVPIGNCQPEDVIVKTVNKVVEVRAEKLIYGGRWGTAFERK